jgi:LmbE family N-acetylglucosaminyl deacetylase
MLHALIDYVQPDFLRVQDPAGEEMNGHIDHASGGRFALAANSTNGVIARRADTYFDYVTAQMPENFSGYWRDEKLAIWNAYKPFDSQVGPTAWDELAGREHRRRIYWPGDQWSEVLMRQIFSPARAPHQGHCRLIRISGLTRISPGWAWCGVST